jgi:hypothetical protein
VPQPWERRLVLAFESTQHPDDGRRRVHVFNVQELAWEDRVGSIGRDIIVEGRSRRPMGGLVWAGWKGPVQIDRERWYQTHTMEVDQT